MGMTAALALHEHGHVRAHTHSPVPLLWGLQIFRVRGEVRGLLMGQGRD